MSLLQSTENGGVQREPARSNCNSPPLWLWAFPVLWTVLVGLALGWNMLQAGETIEDLARVGARASFEKDLLFRQWAALHGGVYVPVTEQTPPNLYLTNVTERDLTTPSGRPLTLMNPAYMTRQVHEMAEERYGVRSHITSLKPLRPENAPDPWEREALEAFDRGVPEVSSVEVIDGQPHLRMMRPVRAEASCLKCHAAQGYREGEIRGGIGVAVPLKEYQAGTSAHQRVEILAHGGIWALGLIVFGIGGRRFWRSERERGRAQAALRQSEARHTTVLQTTLDGFVRLDLRGRLLEVNQAYCRMSGYTEQELLGMSVADLEVVEKPAEIGAHLRRLVADGGGRFERSHRRKDGRLIQVEVSVQYRPEEGGYLVAFLRDITERKQLEAQYLRAQRLEGVGALASGIAHDLNNILTPILMSAPLLRETTPDADSRAMLDTIEGCAQRGADIIKQLLTFARGTPGARVPLPMRHLLRDMEKIIRETFPRDIQARVEVEEALWGVLGDATQLNQALMNLCVNARDAMPEGGVLKLGARNVRVDEAFAAMTAGAQPGAYVCVSVEDSGGGIAPEHLDRIFDPFFTTKEVGKGTGLGLATVLGIVRGHQGFVRVDSRAGAGTRFELYFPASAQSAGTGAEVAERAAVAVPRGGGELVIVVDDEGAVRRSVQRMLESHGYRVVVAGQGAEGLAAFSRHQGEVRAVLTDMMMPVMNGPTMVVALRAMAPGLVIVGMTGLPERKEVKGLESLKLSALLIKPFSGEEVLRVLHRALKATKPETLTGEVK